MSQSLKKDKTKQKPNFTLKRKEKEKSKPQVNRRKEIRSEHR